MRAPRERNDSALLGASSVLPVCSRTHPTSCEVLMGIRSGPDALKEVSQ